MLDDRLRQYKADYGTPRVYTIGSPGPSAKKSKSSDSTGGHNLQEAMASKITSSSSSSSPSAKGRGKAYVPQTRSGAYALILTLHQFKQERRKEEMNKAELMKEAQTLSDASFTVPLPGSHYTAWSSMGSLIKKGLVNRIGCPAKFSLSDEGVALAVKLLANDESAMAPVVHEPFAWLNDQPASPAAAVDVAGPSSMDTDNSADNASWGIDDHTIVTESAARVPDTDPGKRFCFDYVDADGHQVTNKDKAAVTFMDDCLGFLIRCRLEDLRSSGFNYQLDPSRTSALGFVFAFLSDTHAPESSQPLRSRLLDSQSCVSGLSVPPSLTTDIPSSSAQHEARFIDSQKSNKFSKKPTGHTVSTHALSKAVNHTTIQPTNNPTALTALSRPAVKEFPKSATLNNNCWGISRPTAVNLPSDALNDSINKDPLFVLEPGSFDIILCIDNAEIYGNQRQNVTGELQKNKIGYDIRKLQIGDFLWIAKEKLGLQRELVLDYIVERKRMDDLAGSIIDGRFHEQKFRLRNSGLNYVVYLVEDAGFAQHSSLPEETLQQAVVNTQVIDQFLVKRTKDLRETAAYLTIFTRYLLACYLNKRLVGVTRRQLTVLPPCDIKKDQQHNLLTFEELNNSAVKSRPLTVQEMFGRQLIRLSGLTVEKAAAIVKRYPTPSSLLEAYASCDSEKQRHGLLTDVKFGVLSRRLGQSLSRQISQLYYSMPS